MNKETFMKKLKSGLTRLPKEEQAVVIQDFEEHFAMGLEEGKSEDHISTSLGSPHQIAKEMLATHHLEKVEATATAGNVFRAVWAVIGLGFFNLVIVLGPFIALASILVAGWVMAITFIGSPLLVIVSAVIFTGTFEMFDLFFSIVLLGLGLFIAMGMFFISRILMSGFVRYLTFNTKIVKGGLKHA